MFTIPTKTFKGTEEDDYLKSQFLSKELIENVTNDDFEIYISYDKYDNTYAIRVGDMANKKIGLSTRLAMFVVKALKEKIPSRALTDIHWPAGHNKVYTSVASNYSFYARKLHA